MSIYKEMIDGHELLERLRRERRKLENKYESIETVERYNFAIMCLEDARKHIMVSREDYDAMREQFLMAINRGGFG